ncbi:MAG: DNA binding protein (J protein) [Microvirus sp.]|nr:MAG: DNA binding protein (J protein) [Microvirus sp.]
MKRMKMSRHASKRSFRTNSGVHPKNHISPPVSRGGWRL